jgi:DNA-binding CsgD family transcriptional regulator/tetratricopeptide (TPR) repeat protein
MAERAQETGAVQLVAEQGGARVESRLDLLERDAELAALEELIRGAGQARLLAIEGPPGIGKTSLIQEARIRGHAAGMLVLGARGSELERRFSFGVVRQLFEPFMVRLSEEERSEFLVGAAGLSLAVFEPDVLTAEPAAESSLALLHGLYWLAANISTQRPLLLVVDDLHWSDLSSLRWLAYLLPRLDGLEVSLVVALRPKEAGEAPELLSQIVSDPEATVVDPAPLSSAASARLIREALSPEADDAFCAACHEITGGNPMLLRELRNGILAEEVAPSGVNIPRLRKLAARAGSRALSARLSRLPPEATSLSQAVAVLGGEVAPQQAAALAGLDEESVSQALADLARVDILRPQPPLEFVHPLIRAAVYDTLTLGERADAHMRAARLLSAAQVEPERVAAHLLLVSPASDAAVVDGLREAARSARAHGASENAVAYLRRALAEPPVDYAQVDVLLELGSAEALVDGQAAAMHLREAHALIDEPRRRAEVGFRLGRQLDKLHRTDESIAVFKRALDEIGGADDELERLLWSGFISIGPGLPSTDSEEVSRRLADVRSHGGETTLGEKFLLALLALHDARRCEPADHCVALARRAVAGGTLVRAEDSAECLDFASIVLAAADRDGALELLDEGLTGAHARGSIGDFAIAKWSRARVLFMRGDLADAVADSREALASISEWGLESLALLSWVLAHALMEQGRLDEAAAALDTGGVELDREGHPVYPQRGSRARLRMLRGDLAGGLEELLAAGRSYEAGGGRNPAFMAWRSRAALALLQLGERPEAGRLAGEELELARAWGAPRALGAALTAMGLVEGGKAGLVLLEEAVDVLVDSPAKLEHAKARTELGAALRRANRRSEAREHLRRAIELGTICGATPVVTRAETELLATGARPRRVALTGVESLTPSERRVAEMAAEGPTNREIAQALFVTPKTVEVHLSSAYRKLGISSRSQLAAALGSPRDERKGN